MLGDTSFILYYTISINGKNILLLVNFSGQYLRYYLVIFMLTHENYGFVY